MDAFWVIVVVMFATCRILFPRVRPEPFRLEERIAPLEQAENHAPAEISTADADIEVEEFAFQELMRDNPVVAQELPPPTFLVRITAVEWLPGWERVEVIDPASNWGHVHFRPAVR